jgi:hypothetical protein
MLAQFLSRARSGLVKGEVAPMRANRDGSGPVLWRVAPGVQGFWAIAAMAGARSM